MKFFKIYIYLKSVKTLKNYKHEEFTQLLDFFKDNLIQQKVILDCSYSSYMTESNDCITLQFQISSKLNKDLILNSIKKTVNPNMLNFEFDLENKYKTFHVSNNEILNFLSLEHSPLISREDIPDDVKTIQFNTDMCFSSNDKANFVISLFNDKNELISLKPYWIEQANIILQKHFTAYSVDSLTLKIVYIILFGSNPKDNIIKSLDNEFFITTEFMDNFDFFEKNKVNKNVILSQNID